MPSIIGILQVFVAGGLMVCFAAAAARFIIERELEAPLLVISAAFIFIGKLGILMIELAGG